MACSMHPHCSRVLPKYGTTVSGALFTRFRACCFPRFSTCLLTVDRPSAIHCARDLHLHVGIVLHVVVFKRFEATLDPPSALVLRMCKHVLSLTLAHLTLNTLAVCKAGDIISCVPRARLKAQGISRLCLQIRCRRCDRRGRSSRRMRPCLLLVWWGSARSLPPYASPASGNPGNPWFRSRAWWSHRSTRR